VAFGLLGVLYAGAALLVPLQSPRQRLRRDILLGAVWLVVLTRGNPAALPAVRLEPGEELAHLSSGAAGEVAVVQRGRERLIRVDNHYVLGGTADRVHQERQGHLPLLLHPEARRVAFVGSATGISAGAALAHPVETIHLVEIVPDVARAAARFFGAANRGVYEDPRSRVVLDDARNFLRATRERFDLVVADLFVPWQAGTGSLYAAEHFRAVRAHLRDGGVFCQWLPLYQLSETEFQIVAATFVDVFPQTALFRGDFYGSFPIVALVGFTGRPPAPAAVSAAARRLGERGETDRWVTDPAGVWSLYVGPLAGPAQSWGNLPRNRDRSPRIEFLAARSHAGRRGKLDPFTGIAFASFGEAVRRAAEAGGDPLHPDLPAEARQAAAGGALFQAAGALYAAGRTEDASRALAAAAERLPRRLLADAPADPTAAELWFE
jgi:spermidine synthase